MKCGINKVKKVFKEQEENYLLELEYHNEFKRDVKKIQAQNKNKQDLVDIVKLLRNKEKLPIKYRNHPLSGNYKGSYELHIWPDWLLIYKITKSSIILIRTGSHSELFK